jgi:hypothetical protein
MESRDAAEGGMTALGTTRKNPRRTTLPNPPEFGAVLAGELRLWQAVVQETGVKLK